jgi:hypothetical protein
VGIARLFLAGGTGKSWRHALLDWSVTLMCAWSQCTTEGVSIVMLLAYGDESMDETATRVCSAGAVVGTEAEWASIESKWVERNNGIPFHANDCDSDKGDYAPRSIEDKDKKHKENKDLYRDLITLLAHSGLAGFASTMDIAAQKAAFPLMPDHVTYYRVLVDVIEFMKNCASDMREIVEITFDSRAESEFNATLVYANLREENPEWKQYLASKLSFECSRNNPRIQIGDLFVREAMKDLDNLIGPVKRPPRKSWLALRETHRFVAHNWSREWFRDLLPEMPKLVKQAGFSREDYEAWLAERKRQDNLTAYIEFFHWYRSRGKGRSAL